MRTVTIQIGNSDNKLSQEVWSNFVDDVRCGIESIVHQVHFGGGSDWDAPWQNACWVCEIDGADTERLKQRLKESRVAFHQDSVAITFGDTILI